MPFQDPSGRWWSDDRRWWWDGAAWRLFIAAKPVKWWDIAIGVGIPLVLAVGSAVIILLMIQSFCRGGCSG